jgi:hypothetical protein
MSGFHKKFLQRSIFGRSRVGHSSRGRTQKEGVVKHQVKCQIFIEQRDGGTVWVPCKTNIVDGIGNQIIIGHKGKSLSPADKFPTLGSAAEAAQHQAFGIIQKKYPGVQRDDIDWSLVCEDVKGFVTV